MASLQDIDPSVPPELWPWQCQTCTLVNDCTAEQCVVCDSRRIGGPAGGAVAATTPPPEVPAAAARPSAAPVHQTSVSHVAVGSTKAGINEEEKRARAEEQRMKRRKKDEEQARVRQQFEEDRRSHAERAGSHIPPPGSSSTAGPTSAAACGAPTGGDVSGVASRETSKVRLQVRCPGLNRTVNGTDRFTPESTLGEVRAFLCVELARPEARSAANRLHFDDDLPDSRPHTEEQRLARDAREQFRQQTERLLQQAAEARQSSLPPEESIVLRLAAPPRTRFSSAEDMALTLRAAGLCPSAALIMEIAAPEVQNHLQEVAAVTEEQETENHDGTDEEDSDDEDSQGMAPGIAGGSDQGGSGTFGAGSRRPYGGSRSADWRFGPSRQKRQTGDRVIGPNGELVDPVNPTAAGSGGGTVLAGSTTADSGSAAERRAAALAALERRNAVANTAAPVATPTCAFTTQASPAAPAAAASNAVPMTTAARKKAEREQILARVAAEREDYKQFHAPVPTAAATLNASHATAVEEESPEVAEARAARLRALSARQQEAVVASGHGNSAENEVSLDATSKAKIERAPGAAMGSTMSRQEREAERIRILQEMEADRSLYAERHVSAPSGTLPAGNAAASHPSQASRQLVGAASLGEAVRLTIRCAETGRSITTTAFVASSELKDVRDFAVGELRGRTEDTFDLAVTFPRQVFEAAGSDMHRSLHDLGLFPSATLLLQKPRIASEPQGMPCSPVLSPITPATSTVVMLEAPEPPPALARAPSDLERAEARARAALNRACRSTESSATGMYTAAPTDDASPLARVNTHDCLEGEAQLSQLRVRLPDGAVRRLSVTRDSPVGVVFEQLVADLEEQVEHASAEDGRNRWSLLVPFPRRVLGDEDLMLTLEALDLWPRGTLVIQHWSQQGQVRRGGQGFSSGGGAMGERDFRQWMDGMDWDDSHGRGLRSDDDTKQLTSQCRCFAFGESAEAHAGGAMASTAEAEHTDRTRCAICYCEYISGDQLCALPCTHVFHEECAHRWLRRSNACCVCRAVLN